MSNYKFEIGQVYTVRFFENEIDVTVTKINSKGVTLKNSVTCIELKDYKESELQKMIIQQVK
jgi:hypothetical protein